jgi:hypothetical protein
VTRILKTLLATLTLLTMAMVATAAPIPMSAVGIDQAIVVGSGGRIPILTGGKFSGTIEGFAADFWCVDVENYVNPVQVYQGNVTLLSNWTNGQNAEVRNGTLGAAGWVIPGGAPALNPLQRYQAAAYLITQTAAFGGADVDADNDYQRAIWELLDTTGGGDQVSQTAGSIVLRNAAITYILGNPNYGKGTWAVVSGAVDARGGFTSTKVQTFLTQVQPPSEVPEPGTYAMMGAGLIGLAALARRKRS